MELQIRTVLEVLGEGAEEEEDHLLNLRNLIGNCWSPAFGEYFPLSKQILPNSKAPKHAYFGLTLPHLFLLHMDDSMLFCDSRRTSFFQGQTKRVVLQNVLFSLSDDFSLRFPPCWSPFFTNLTADRRQAETSGDLRSTVSVIIQTVDKIAKQTEHRTEIARYRHHCKLFLFSTSCSWNMLRSALGNNVSCLYLHDYD